MAEDQPWLPGGALFCLYCGEVRSAEGAVQVFQTGFRRVEGTDVPLGICASHNMPEFGRGGIRFLHLEMGRRRGPFEPRGHREAVRLTPLVRGVIGGVRHERFRHEGAFCIINTEN